MQPYRLVLLKERFAFCKLPENVSGLPDWAQCGEILVAIYTKTENSILCEERFVPTEIKAERGWRAFRINETLDFSLTGVMASLLNPLSDNEISVLTFSTYDTDYVLVRDFMVEKSMFTLENAGYVITVQQ